MDNYKCAICRISSLKSINTLVFLFEQSDRNIGSTNGVSLGQNNLFGWPMTNEVSVQQTCLITVIMFAIPFGDASRTEITYTL